jgi:hypothetical protein
VWVAKEFRIGDFGRSFALRPGVCLLSFPERHFPASQKAERGSSESHINIYALESPPR